MITVQEAKHQVVTNAFPLPVAHRPLEHSHGYVLAQDLFAPLSLPSFRQSSMDGYAIHHNDVTEPGTPLRAVGEIKAGAATPSALQRGTTHRIFTGAPVPEGATAVVMQEKTAHDGHQITFFEFPVKDGQNIRKIGQQIQAGDLALPAGTLLTPGAIGFLAGLNILTLPVFRKPRVGILITGDELVKPGEKPLHGQVYESNSHLLNAALQAEGITEITTHFVPDDARLTQEAIAKLKSENDVVIASGGISVGDFDFVGKAMQEEQVETLFYKVRQRPGKPLFFGRTDTTLFFGLPGNPAASLVCFYEYVLPALRKLAGRSEAFLPTLTLPITRDYTFVGERDEFVKASATTHSVTPLEGQESFILRSFALTNALIFLPLNRNNVKAGELVEVHLLPFFC